MSFYIYSSYGSCSDGNCRSDMEEYSSIDAVNVRIAKIVAEARGTGEEAEIRVIIGTEATIQDGKVNVPGGPRGFPGKVG